MVLLQIHHMPPLLNSSQVNTQTQCWLLKHLQQQEDGLSSMGRTAGLSKSRAVQFPMQAHSNDSKRNKIQLGSVSISHLPPFSLGLSELDIHSSRREHVRFYCQTLWKWPPSPRDKNRIFQHINKWATFHWGKINRAASAFIPQRYWEFSLAWHQLAVTKTKRCGNNK